MTPTDDDYIKELIRRALAPVLNRLAELERQVTGKAVATSKPEAMPPKKKKKLPGPVINSREAAKRREEEDEVRGRKKK